MASSDLMVLRYVKEVTKGVTPATPALSQIRFTGESINYNITNTKTAEINPERVETDLVQTEGSVGGGFNFELSYGTFDDFMESVFCGAWTTNVLKNGTSQEWFSLQKQFPDVPSNNFHTFAGTTFEGMNLKMELGKIVTGDFQIMGMGLSIASAQIAGATFPAVSTTTPMNAVANVQNLTISGVPYSGCISSLDLSIKNNLREIRCIGSMNPVDHKMGTLEVTGSMNFYFNEGSNYQNFLDGTEFPVAFDLQDDAGNKYSFLIPRIKWESGQVVAGSKNSDVMFNAKWRALKDSTTGVVIQVTRTPHP
jgi:hypothetical protein